MIQRICICSLAVPLLWSPIAAALAEKVKPTFGRRQVEQLLDDRPEMRPVLQSDDAVFTWAVKQFEGGGERIYWDHREPAAGQASEFIPSSGNDARRIPHL